MREPSRAEPIRALLAALTCTSLTLTLARITADLVVGALRAGSSLDRPVAAVVVGLGTAAAGALAAGCWLLAAASLGRRVVRLATWCDRLGARLTPIVLRRAVGLTVGAGLGVAALGGVASGAEHDLGWEVTTTAASETESDAAPVEAALPESALPESALPDAEPPEAAQPSPEPSEDGTPEPTLPDISVTPASEGATEGRLASPTPAPPEAAEAVAGTVTVQRGDSLWRIAAEHLPGASNAEIAAAWPRWYEANRAVIGAEPALIHPGQVLQVPSDATMRPLP